MRACSLAVFALGLVSLYGEVEPPTIGLIAVDGTINPATAGYIERAIGISSEHNTHTILPLPIDLFAPYLKKEN